MLLLTAVLVGGFYIYAQQAERRQDQKEKDWLKEEAKINERKTDQAREKAKKLQSDDDGDGLTLAEEKRLGTSDTKIDSDDDGIPDKYDIIPTRTGRKVVKYISWQYKTPWKWEIGLPVDVISYYEKVPRPKWTGDKSYYADFIDANDIGIEQLAEGLNEAIQTNKSKLKWTYYDEVMFIVSMVQQLHYTSDALTGFDDFTKYPMQTINDGTGDCEDTAILAAALLHKLEYEVKLVYIDPQDKDVAHLGIAVWGDDTEGKFWSKDGKDFYYIETTDPKWKFGELPEEWKEGTDIELIDL